jgi:heat shock protein 1/8
MIPWTFTVVSREVNHPRIQIEYKYQRKEFKAEEIYSMVLMKLKMIMEAYLKLDVKNVVITVPTYFSDSQRKASNDDVVIVGFKVIQIINKPIVTAIAYGLNTKWNEKNTILIFDLGGGTFDVFVLTVESGKFEVKVVGRDVCLRGEYFHNRMLNYSVQQFKIRNKKDLNTRVKSLQRLRSSEYKQ